MDTEIKFRVASEDKARFEAAAEGDRRKLSDWIRLTLLNASHPTVTRQKLDAAEPKVLPKDPKEVAEAVRTIKPPAKRGTVEPKKLSKAVADTRTQQERMDDFYRANMAKGKK